MSFFIWVVGILLVMGAVFLIEWVIDFWVTWPFEQ